MGVVAKGIQITRAVKNVGRLRQIVTVLSRQGFGDVIERAGLGSYLPNQLINWTDAKSGKTLGERMKSAFEELGPTFVKFGQILSTRPDLVPEAVIQELIKLQDQVQPLPYSVIQQVVEAELKKSDSKNTIENCFQKFDPQPLASASIGQVHAAVLKTGETVVVKVQRPDVRKSIDTDISLLVFLAEMFERYFPELRVFNPKVFVEEFFMSLQQELDYKIEANNIAKIGAQLKEIEGIVVPKVYSKYSTHLILVMEQFNGIRINDGAALDAAKIDRNKIAMIGARGFLYSVLKHGLFHGDLHGGNLFVLPGNQLGIIDFGIVGRLSRKSRDQLALMIWSLLQEDYETLCFTYAELGSVDTSVDFDAFSREVRNTLSPYLGLNISDVNTGRVLIEATKVAAKYNIRIPGDWMLVFKAIVTMEGMGRTLDPHFDMIATGESLVQELIQIQYSTDRLKDDGLAVARDFVSLFQSLPRNARWALRKFAKNDYAFEVVSPDVKRLANLIDVNGRRLSRATAATGLLISGAIVIASDRGHHWGDYPALGAILILLGLFLAFKRK
jgi:ubiquinone biosynthesis protein